MGLLDFLFGRKQKAEQEEAPPAQPEPQLTPWQERMQGWHRKSDEEKLAICKEILEMIAPSFENPKIVNPDDDEVELRGRVQGVPIRIQLDDRARVDKAEAKIENRRGWLFLHRDHEKIPKERDPNDDWADEDELRVFVAKGIYVEGDQDDIERSLPTVEGLGAEAKGWLTGELERLQIAFLAVGIDELTAAPEADLDKLPDPAAYLGELVQFLVQSAQLFASGERDMSAEPKVQIGGNVQIGDQVVGAAPDGGGGGAALAPQVNCSYCGTVFLLDSSSQCPNCAGPYQG